MIIVIADDTTGAAEIGGIGLRYGLKVLLSADVVDAPVDVLVIYTNTRSLPESEAVSIMQGLTKKAAALKPSLFYKKIDSVLRGHVMAEIKGQMKVLGLHKALLLPANPALGKTLRNGIYYVNGQPVHEAGFATDPEFPIQQPEVRTMLGASDDVSVLAVAGPLAEGVSVGEASSRQDVDAWATTKNEGVLLAGAASFFTALLHQDFALRKSEKNHQASLPVLLVSGTAHRQSHDKQNGYEGSICQIPVSLFTNEDSDTAAIETWANEAISLLKRTSRCMMVVGQQKAEQVNPQSVLRKIGLAVKSVLQTVQVNELWIEGGATAYTVIQALEFTEFTPTEEWQQGVVRMKVDSEDRMHLTIKPGSYAWPEQWEKTFQE